MTPQRATTMDHGVRYYAARSTVLAVHSPFAKVKLCRVNFGKDRSMYASFRYLREKRGLVSIVKGAADSPGKNTYDLAKQGTSVPVDVKYSHHASGHVRFSRDGFKVTLPRKDSFVLTSGSGVVFQLHVHWLHGFDWVDEPRSRDLPAVFGFPDEHPFGLRVVAEWVPKTAVAMNTESGGVAGPRAKPFTG